MKRGAIALNIVVDKADEYWDLFTNSLLFVDLLFSHKICRFLKGANRREAKYVS